MNELQRELARIIISYPNLANNYDFSTGHYDEVSFLNDTSELSEVERCMGILLGEAWQEELLSLEIIDCLANVGVQRDLNNASRILTLVSSR